MVQHSTWQVLAADTVFLCTLQEDMYSFVTYSDDQATKGKGTTIVEA